MPLRSNQGRLRARVPARLLLAGAILAAALWASLAQAKDVPPEKPATIRTTKEGLHFNVPPDWPVEKRNGVVGPIPIEEYLARKFTSLEAQIQLLEQHLNGVDVRLRVLEERAKQPPQGLQSAEPPARSAP